jgi:hypothetical protein
MYSYEFVDMKKYFGVTLKYEFTRTNYELTRKNMDTLSSYNLIYTNWYPFQKEVHISNVFIDMKKYFGVILKYEFSRTNMDTYEIVTN